MHLFRSSKHCFFHDDVRQEEVQAKLQRRICRFLDLRDNPKDLLFVRSCASTAELLSIDDLHSDLVQFFGTSHRRVLLLVIVDGQNCRHGPVVHTTNASIIFYLQPYDTTAMDPDGGAYCQAIAVAAELALNVPEASPPSIGFGSRGQLAAQLSVSNSAALAQGLLQGPDGVAISVKPWDAGLVASFDGIDFPCFDAPRAQLFNLRVSPNSCAEQA